MILEERTMRRKKTVHSLCPTKKGGAQVREREEERGRKVGVERGREVKMGECTCNLTVMEGTTRKEFHRNSKVSTFW